MNCLDTDFLIAILRGKEGARKKAEEIDKEGRGATTSINAFEVFFGAYRSARKSENIKQASRLLDRLFIFPLDYASSQKAADLSADLVAKGKSVDYRDVMIAAIAIENQLTLVTRNASHFSRIKGLKMATW